MRRLMEVVRSGRVDLTPLLTHRFSLDQIAEGYRLLESEPAASWRWPSNLDSSQPVDSYRSSSPSTSLCTAERIDRLKATWRASWSLNPATPASTIAASQNRQSRVPIRLGFPCNTRT